MKYPNIRRKTNIAQPSNIPPDVALRTSKAKRSSVGRCDCGKMGTLNSRKEYICRRCARLNARPDPNDDMIFYGRAGSNYHRINNRHVDCHYLDPANYVSHFSINYELHL